MGTTTTFCGTPEVRTNSVFNPLYTNAPYMDHPKFIVANLMEESVTGYNVQIDLNYDMGYHDPDNNAQRNIFSCCGSHFKNT